MEASIEKVAIDNPDVPLDFIRDVLDAMTESAQGQREAYRPGVIE